MRNILKGEVESEVEVGKKFRLAFAWMIEFDQDVVHCVIYRTVTCRID